MPDRVFGGGGPNSSNVWWPAGLEVMDARQRVEALAGESWIDENPPESTPEAPMHARIYRDGRRVLLCVGYPAES